MIRNFIIFFLILLSVGCRNSSVVKEAPQNQSGTLCGENEKEFTDQFNNKFYQIRSDLNLMVPVRDPKLDRSALNFAKKLKNRNSIIYKESERPLIRLQQEGIKKELAAENIAIIKNDSKLLISLMKKWINGKEEKNNLTNSRYHFYGFGFDSNKKYCYCVLLLTN